jgi:hypothetical protein
MPVHISKIIDNSKPLDEKIAEQTKRLGVRDLVVGEYYLHRNGHTVRTILSFEGDHLRWCDAVGTGMCSKKYFVKVCPSKASDEAVKADGMSDVSGVLKQHYARKAEFLREKYPELAEALGIT